MHSWPGNTRELENVIHFALLVSSGEEILPQHLNLPTPLQVLARQLDHLCAWGEPHELSAVQGLLEHVLVQLASKKE
ncbi:hypothetical protein D3C80_2087690 [compost metagenome]